MKLIIEIDEEIYKSIKIGMRNRDDMAEIGEAVENGTPIPDNDCDNCEKAWTDKCERAECYENNYKHWTPYQKGGKECR